MTLKIRETLAAYPVVFHHIMDWAANEEGPAEALWDVGNQYSQKTWLKMFRAFRALAREKGPMLWRETEARHYIRATFMPDGLFCVKLLERGETPEDLVPILTGALKN